MKGEGEPSSSASARIQESRRNRHPSLTSPVRGYLHFDHGEPGQGRWASAKNEVGESRRTIGFNLIPASTSFLAMCQQCNPLIEYTCQLACFGVARCQRGKSRGTDGCRVFATTKKTSSGLFVVGRSSWTLISGRTPRWPPSPIILYISLQRPNRLAPH